MKIFSTKKISEIDRYTIENEPILSIDLMERAAYNLAKYFLESEFFKNKKSFCIISGVGNNGGDGLALARLLHFNGKKVRVYLFGDIKKQSKDNATNWKRLENIDIFKKHVLSAEEIHFLEDEIIVDALYGTGLSRPLEGPVLNLVEKINNSSNFVVSIDIPSGLLGEDNRFNNSQIVQADLTLTLEFPKLSFFFPENEKFVGKFEIVKIFLSEEAKNKTETCYYYTDFSEINLIYKRRTKFSEKRDFGHALIVGGSKGKIGAILLASKACYRTGVGLLTVHCPNAFSTTLNVFLPEIMLAPDKNADYITQCNIKDIYTAIGIGPGLGTNIETTSALLEYLNAKLPIVLDADALNIIAKNDLLKNIKPYTIITPHIREFDRLFGEHSTHYDRFLTANQVAKDLKIIVVLKGAYTQIHLPNGNIFFNSTGNQGLATGGSGDVLTGIITGLLAQGYTPENAAIFGVFLHGLAADLAVKDFYSYETLLPSDVIKYLSNAFQLINNQICNQF